MIPLCLPLCCCRPLSSFWTLLLIPPRVLTNQFLEILIPEITNGRIEGYAGTDGKGNSVRISLEVCSFLGDYPASFMAIDVIKHSAELHARTAVFVIKINLVISTTRTPLMYLQVTHIRSISGQSIDPSLLWFKCKWCSRFRDWWRRTTSNVLFPSLAFSIACNWAFEGGTFDKMVCFWHTSTTQNLWSLHAEYGSSRSSTHRYWKAGCKRMFRSAGRPQKANKY